MLARVALFPLLLALAGCDGDAPLVPDTDTDVELSLDEDVLVIRPWEQVTIESELWLTYQDDGTWNASWTGTTRNLHPFGDTDGCYDYGAGSLGDTVRLPSDAELVVGTQRAVLEPVPGMGGFPQGHLRAASGTGAEVGGRIAVDLPGGEDILGLPPAPYDASYTVLVEDAAPGDPWALVTWTPTADTERIEIFFGEQLGHGTIICRVANDGYAVLPVPPEDSPPPLPLRVTSEAIAEIELGGLTTLVRASPVAALAQEVE